MGYAPNSTINNFLQGGICLAQTALEILYVDTTGV